MGKKEKKIITLSEIDHKLQFINVIAVIGDISPIISRSKLTKIELQLLDETMKRPGFNVKLNMKSEMLNHFLNVAKKGFIIKLSDIKVIKNEGEVYGVVQEEEEITLYNDSPLIHKWYPGEKLTAVTDTVMLKIQNVVKWKKANFKEIEVLHEDDKDQSKTRRSGFNSPEKSQSSKSQSKISVNDGSAVSYNKNSKIIKTSNQVIDNLSACKENNDTISRRSKQELSTEMNEPSKRPKASKTSISIEKTESPRTNSSRTNISSSPSRVTRGNDASKLSRSSSLSRLKKSDISQGNKSVSLSRLNKSESLTILCDSNFSSSSKNLTKGVEAKGESSNSEFVKSMRFTRSVTTPKVTNKTASSDSDENKIKSPQSFKTSKIKKITASKDSDEEISNESSSLETQDCSSSSKDHNVSKEINDTTDKSQRVQIRSSATNKNTDHLLINTSRKSARNKSADYSNGKNNISNKKRSIDSEAEENVVSYSKISQKNQIDCILRDTENNIASVKSNEMKIKRNKNYYSGTTDDKVETKGDGNLKSNCKILTKVGSKEATKKCVNEEEHETFETPKVTRQTIQSKIKKSSSLGKMDSPVIIDSNCSSPSTSSKSSKSECNKSREFRTRKNFLDDESEVNNQLNKNVDSKNSITRRRRTYLETDSPTRKKTRLAYYGSGHSTDTSSEASPRSKQKPGGLLKNPTLNSSDSTLSVSSNLSLRKTISPKRSMSIQKRELKQKDLSSELFPVSRKKSKLGQETVVNRAEEVKVKPDQESDASHPVDNEPQKSIKPSETVSIGESNRNNNDNVTDLGLSKKDSKTNQNESKKLSNNHGPGKTARLDKEEVIISPKTRKQVFQNSVQNQDLSIKPTRNSANIIKDPLKNNRESGKSGIYETYLRPLTKKLNFVSVDRITDISLNDLEEVYVPEKFDLQCKVVSEFVLVEEGIQIATVQDGTICKCNALKIPQGQSWDIVSKEILDSPIVVEKSPTIDIIIFNYFRLDFPIKSGKLFQINNVMAIKFQLKRDPRPEKKSHELFFCVEGQNANLKRLSSQQIKELKERISTELQNSTSSTSISNKVVAEEPASESANFKLPITPKVDDKSYLSSDEKSPRKTNQAVIEERESEMKQRKIKPNDSNSDIDSEISVLRGTSPGEDKTDKGNCGENPETCKDQVNTDKNLKEKMNTTNSSDETVFEETPPLLKEINEILHEESLLGLPLTITEDVHLKNSGSEVTFSQFCEGAKMKGDNFRTSTQNVESDVLKIGSLTVCKTIDLPKDVIVSEETSKMEPLVYCPSGSSASSTKSPKQGKSSQDIQDSQPCSVSVLQEVGVKTISDLKPNNSKSQKVIDDNTSDLSNSSSVKVISSDSSERLDLAVIGSKVSSKIQSTTNVIEVECKLTESSDMNDLLSNVQKKVSLSSSDLSVIAKESGSVLESVCISGNNSNKATTNDDFEVVSDHSSNDSVLAADNTTAKKPVSSFNTSANAIDDLSLDNLEKIAKLIPDRCFYKSPTTAPTLAAHVLNEIYDDENSPIKYFSYCHNRDLPMLTLDVVEKIKNTNTLTMTVTLTSITPSFTDSWKESCIKARCPSCDKMYDVYNAANNKNKEDASATDAISVGSHIVCPDSQCCNQILGIPEFHFSVEFKLDDGTPVTALIGGEEADRVFGCSAARAIRSESGLSQIGIILEKITKRISEKRRTTVIVTREDICNPKSGPLYLTFIGF